MRSTPVERLETYQAIYENLRRDYHRRGDHAGQEAMEYALERLRLAQSEKLPIVRHQSCFKQCQRAVELVRNHLKENG